MATEVKYLRRAGVDRLTEPVTTCFVCGDVLHRRRGARGGRCGTCTRYHQRHGRERPLELVMRLTERDVARELAASGTLPLSVGRSVTS